MIYKTHRDKKISQLGFGCMRLPTETSKTDKIDDTKAIELLEHAYNNGVNHFDTAYFYHSGDSQRVVGKALSNFPRDSWYLSNKLPGNFMSRVSNGLRIAPFSRLPEKIVSGIDEVFEGQLEECGVDYFDFYMLHNVSDSTYDLYTDEKLGMVDYMLKQKEAGRIRHLGFSSHAYPDTLERFLNWRDDCFEFALIQLNYLDWDLQEAGKKYDMLTESGISVFVMEPVRGGKLAAPGKGAAEILKSARPYDTPVSWAFRFLQSLPNVISIQSGMSTMEQLKENLELFSREDPTTESEKGILKQAVETMSDFVQCTACRYCCDSFPKGLNIPFLLYLYNEFGYEKSWLAIEGIDSLSGNEKPGICTVCGECIQICPQNIDIPEMLGKLDKMLSAK